MDSTTIPFTIQLPENLPFVFCVQPLVERFPTLTDKRQARGIRYPLEVLLRVAVLARLAGESRLEPMADWARLRAADLAALLGLPRARMPHQGTWRRVCGHAVDVDAKGDDLWFLKENQKTLSADLELLFVQPQFAKGWSDPGTDFTTATTIKKGQGRL